MLNPYFALLFLVLLPTLECLTRQGFIKSPQRSLTRSFVYRPTSPSSSTQSPTSSTYLNLPPETNPRSGYYSYEQWSKAFVSVKRETEYFVSDIEGQIPSTLQGTLFRNMPANFERGDQTYGHYLDGDGMIARLSIANGRAHFMCRFVKTKEFAEEEAANKVLWRSTFRTQRKGNVIMGLIDLNNAFDLDLKNNANTNAVMWGGRLFALFEAGVPIELDPNSLETVGEASLNVGMKRGLPVFVPSLHALSPRLHDSIFGSCMTAHPKIDPQRKRLVGWTWRAEAGNQGPLKTFPRLSIHEWDEQFQCDTGEDGDMMEGGGRGEEDGKPTTITLTSTTTAPHDFSLTKNYYVFIQNRVFGNTLPYILGTKTAAQCVDIDASKKMILTLVKRPKGRSKQSNNKDIGNNNNNDNDNNDKLDGKKVKEEGEGEEEGGKDDNDNTSPSVNEFNIELTPGFTIHSVCAFENEESHTLELYTTAWETQHVASGKVKGGLLGSWEGKAPIFDNIPITILYKTVVCTDTGTLISHAPLRGLERTIVEHPHINPRYEGKKVRYLWSSLGSTQGISSPPLGYMRIDLHTGEKQEWFAPLHTFCEEVVIVPKTPFPPSSPPPSPAAAAAAGGGRGGGGGGGGSLNHRDTQTQAQTQSQTHHEGEDDVWILASMFSAVKNKSCVGIFDGKDITKGPVARIWLQHPLPHSLHGSFTTELFEPVVFR